MKRYVTEIFATFDKTSAKNEDEDDWLDSNNSEAILNACENFVYDTLDDGSIHDTIWYFSNEVILIRGEL